MATGSEVDATGLRATDQDPDKEISAAEAVEGAIARAQAVQPKINFMVPTRSRRACAGQERQSMDRLRACLTSSRISTMSPAQSRAMDRA
jgi:Asp-tRNA(Asn)/Glu-tRNA(Gln) amidotransferase A subunit family amidase